MNEVRRMTQQAVYPAAGGLVRVYRADAAAARPTAALVWVHGGGFAAGDVDMPEADWVSRTLAARGVTVVSVDYRLVGDGCRYPAPSDDVITAWNWTLEHADGLGIDLARTALGGASAGGNLVTGSILRILARAAVPTGAIIDSAGGAPAPGATPEVAQETRAPSANSELPQGVFLAYPTLLAVQPAPDATLRALLDADPDADTFGPAPVREMYERYLGGSVDDAPLPAVPGLAEASELAGFPPVLMVNSEADELRVSGELFAETLAAAGVPVERATEPGTRHGHLNRPDESAASATIDRIVRWLDGLTSASITEGSTP